MLISIMLAVGCIYIKSSLIKLTSTVGFTAVDEGVNSIFSSANALGTLETTNKLFISIEFYLIFFFLFKNMINPIMAINKINMSMLLIENTF